MDENEIIMNHCHKQPIMDYEAVCENMKNCAIQKNGYCITCKYYASKDCRARLMFEAAHAMKNLIAERNGETWTE